MTANEGEPTRKGRRRRAGCFRGVLGNEVADGVLIFFCRAFVGRRKEKKTVEMSRYNLPEL